MARTSKQIKTKEPVKIRLKALANGNQSIYLDIYYQGKRSYEFLKMYIVPEVDATSKELNKETMKCAEVIKCKKISALYNGKANIDKLPFGKMLLKDLLRLYKEHKENVGMTKGTCATIKHAFLKVEAYGGSVMLKDVDVKFCLGFIDYLKTSKNDRQTRNKNVTISPNTAKLYYEKFESAINWAVKKGYLHSNPCAKIDNEEKIKAKENGREYLTKEEVQRLANSKCTNEMIKKAYLFACFCGLRSSDIRKLRWNEVECDGNKMRVRLVMQKTQKVMYIPLSAEAIRWIPEKPKSAKGNDLVFADIPTVVSANIILKQWAIGCGIEKDVTFHTSRHTFATVMLQAGADLYTVKELLGHADIKTTTIYAKIVDDAKEKAMKNLDIFFNN